jgi:4-hydroxy-2-oxoheptanedioate aldolase
MTNSRVLKKLRAGEPWLAEVVGRIGFDFIWFDLEHRWYGMQHLDAMSLASRATGIDLTVRITKEGYHVPMQALEFGANGLMIPHIKSAAEARQWVERVRYPPLGKRGFDGVGADADWCLASPHSQLTHANKEVFLVLQIEDREAVDCAEEIAAVEVVDMLFVGPSDLGISLGVPFDFHHPLMQAANDRGAAASARHSKWRAINHRRRRSLLPRERPAQRLRTIQQGFDSQVVRSTHPHA